MTKYEKGSILFEVFKMAFNPAPTRACTVSTTMLDYHETALYLKFIKRNHVRGQSLMMQK